MQSEQGGVADPTMSRRVDMSDPHEIVITNTLRSQKHINEEATSLGEHLYFQCPEVKLGDIAVNGEQLSRVLPDGIFEKVLKGAAYQWREAPESLLLDFPGGRQIALKAEATVLRKMEGEFDNKQELGEVVPQVVSYLIWHRRDTDSICIEPVVGYLNGDNTGLHIPPMGEATLRTSIRLKKAA